MVEHVRQGGNPYDLRGQHISETVSQLNTLSQFRRAQHGRVYEGSAANLVTETNQYYQQLNQNLKYMANSRGYQKYFESWQPAEVTESDMVVEDLREMFIETRIDPRIEQALPMLARIQKESQAMKEADIFESWASKLVEGTWAVPETPEQIDELKMWMSQPRPLGPDAEDVTDVLFNLIGDDALFDQLAAMAQEDPTADAVPLVQAWVDRNEDRLPELAELSSALKQPAEPVAEPVPVQEPAVQPEPAEAPPPDQVAPVAPVAEGDDLSTFEEVDEDVVSPRFAGVQQTKHADGSQTTNYQQGPLQTTNKVDAQGKPIKSKSSYDLGVAKVDSEQDHVTGIKSTEVAPRVGDGTDTDATLAAAHQLMPTSAVAAARGADPNKFAAFQKQNPTAVKESSDGSYETQLARIKSLSLLK
jgi:hypothetical protein